MFLPVDGFGKFTLVFNENFFGMPYDRMSLRALITVVNDGTSLICQETKWFEVKFSLPCIDETKLSIMANAYLIGGPFLAEETLPVPPSF